MDREHLQLTGHFEHFRFAIRICLMLGACDLVLFQTGKLFGGVPYDILPVLRGGSIAGADRLLAVPHAA
jgi:hypothetical protein